MPNSVRFVASVEDKVSSQLSKIRDNFDLLGKGAASSTFAGVVGAKALGIGLGLVQEAASHAVDFIGQAIKAANEEQASIAELTTSLKANVAGWDGNTAAIERVLTARMALGFSDDDQRKSLSLLVAATHDVDKALAIQSTAMDLARFKHVDLQTATEALTKVEAGSYRILKSLGIELKAGATQTEALAAVQKIAAGQAADYAATNEGKLLVSQIKVNEAMEKFGKDIAPAQVQAQGLLADAMGTTVDALGLVAPAFQVAGDAVDSYFNQIDRNIGMGIASIINLNKAADNMAGKVADDAVTVTTSIDTMAGKTTDDLGRVASAENKVASSARDAAGAAGRWWGNYRDALKKIADQTITDAFQPLLDNDALIAKNAEVHAQQVIVAESKKVIASKNSSTAQIRHAKAAQTAAEKALHQLEMDQATMLLKMATAGDTTSAAYKTGMSELQTAIDNASGAMKAALLDVQRTINATAAAAARAGATPRQNTTPVRGGGARKPYASGGYFPPGTTGTVGEEGTEGVVMLPGGGAIVIPHSGGSRGSGGGHVFNFNSIWPPTPLQVKAMADALDKHEHYATNGSAASGNRS